MAANGQLVFTDVDKVTFKGVGGASNAVIDTTTGKIGVGVDSPDANLHVVGNCFVSTNLELGGTMTMGTVTVNARHELSAITATGNTTPHTVEFQNATTGLVTTGNVSVGKDLTVTGNVAVDTDTLFVDSVNDRVGVGTSTPGAPLEIFTPTTGSSSTLILKRDVSSYGGSDDGAAIEFKTRFTGNSATYGQVRIRGVDDNLGDSGEGGFAFDTLQDQVYYERMRIKHNGNVGIGTTNPSQTFEVNGDTALIHSADGSDTHNTNDRTLYIGGKNSSGSLVQAKCAIISTPSTSYGGAGQYGRNALHFCVGPDSQNDTNASKTDSRMCIDYTGNVGIGTTDPQGGLDMSGKTFILGQIASAPNGPDGTMYYNSTTQQPLVKVSGLWTPLVNFLPSQISGLVGWYLPENWTGSQWSDISGSGNHVTAYEGTIQTDASRSGSADGANAIFPVLYGSPTAELNFPSAILPSTYTLISVTRYNGSTKKRILDGQIGNWLSGHWGGSSGIAYHGAWLTTTSDRHGDKWVIGVDQNSLYRSKSQSVAWTNDTGGGGTSTNLRLGSVDYEGSDWMCAELIVYNRTLSSDEYTLVSDYIQNKFGIY